MPASHRTHEEVMNIVSNIQRNIVKEIMRECFPKKIKANEHFVAYFVKLLLLDPNWGITENFMNSRENVQKFVKYVISQLEHQFEPKLVTLKMQFYFSCNLETIRGEPHRHRHKVGQRLKRLRDDILLTTEANNQDEIDEITRKLVFYTILASGLGNPVEHRVYMEGNAVLRSVMPPEELIEFLEQKGKVKAQYLDRLIKVTTGIRLFNRDCERGGEGIENLPVLLDSAITAIKTEVQQSLTSVMERVNMLTTIVDKCYILKEDDVQHYKMVFRPMTFPEDKSIEYLKDLLILYRQYELFTRNILDELTGMDENKSHIYQEMDTFLKQIHSTVYMKITVLVDAVYPLFEKLADTWINMQDLVFILAKYGKMRIHLDLYSRSVNFNIDALSTVLQDLNTTCLTDAQRLEHTSEYELKSFGETVTIKSAECVDQNMDLQLPLQYLGFCPWKLVQTQGGLIPGNPNMGIANYNDRNFAFSLPEACFMFSQMPDSHIMHVLDLGRKKPQLINFLMINEQLKDVVDIFRLVEDKVVEKMVEDKGTQLDCNTIMPENNVYYKWNIWDLKREAIILGNVSRYTTVNTQTVKSHSTTAIRCQTYPPKDSSTQTKKDNYTNVPKPSNFIFGLRGRKDDKQFIVELTRPVKE